MQSWKQKKLHGEKHKAKRKKRQKAAISHANRNYMDKILKGKEDNTEQSKPIKDFRFLEKMRLVIRRSVFK